MFENSYVAKSAAYKKDEEIVSFIFDGLKAGLKDIFGD
jgi:hypothetical protein